MKGTNTKPTDTLPLQDQGSDQVQATNENSPVVVNFPVPSDYINSLQQQRVIAPRGLPRRDAAFYIGCSPRMFDGMVKHGEMPSPRLIATKKVWDREELDEFFEALPQDNEDGNPKMPRHPQTMHPRKTPSAHWLLSTISPPGTGSFGNRMRKWCDEAVLPECSSHGLRKAMATRLADLGCSTHEISAIGGWETLKEVERYTKQANRKRLAGQVKTRIDG